MPFEFAIQADSPPARLKPAARTVVIALAIAGILLLFAASMTRSVTYDEEQYIAAGVMARQLLPYRDFVYLQAPLYPFVLAALFELTGGYYLLSARLLTFALTVVSAVLLWKILRRLGAGLLLAVVLMAACLASPFLDPPSSNARNDALPLALLLGGLLLHLRADVGSFWGRAAAALLFGLAAEAKVSYLFGPVALGIHALFAPRTRMLPFLLGTAVAVVPAVLAFAAAPEAFRFGLLDYHLTAPLDWYGRQGLDAMLRWPARLQSLGGWLIEYGNATLLVMAAGLSVAAMTARHGWAEPGPLLLGLLIGAAVLGIVPSPSWPMYYAAVAPLLACCIVHLERSTTSRASEGLKCMVCAAMLLPAAPMLAVKTWHVGKLSDPANWVGLQAHRTALEIRDALPSPGEVATLFPLAVLDANPVRREFASGPFVFRSGDIYPPERLARLHALSPGTLAAAFDAQPPAAIYAGLFLKSWSIPMDAALIEYAEKRGWRLVRTDPDGGRLWLNPEPGYAAVLRPFP